MDLKKIITVNREVKKAKGENLVAKWLELQDAVNSYVDGSKSLRGAADKTGLRQLLERKEGLFRMKMMGKRVNFAARSVISADPFIQTCEIGIPRFVAQTLTFPEPVTPYNREAMRERVLAGPKGRPGANMIENVQSGSKIYL